jgi:predicted outer membrane repeat protein
MTRTFLVGLVLLVAVSQPARGDIIALWADGSGDYPTIQDAIDDACDGDVIYLFPGTYTGSNNTDIDFLGKSITVQSVAPDFPSIVAATIIDCNGSEAEPHQGFYFHSEDANAVVSGLTITNGYAVEDGGGIEISGSSPTISYCTITDCFAGEDGGGISCLESNSVITNCTFTNNSAADDGGGIYSDESRPIIENCTFSGNSALYGGGLYSSSAYVTYYEPLLDLTIPNCTFIANSAAYGGGGIACGQRFNLQIVDSVISHNSSDYGGGLMGAGEGTTLKITNSTISHNTSSNPDFSYDRRFGGGGIWWGGSKVRINKCTINANRAAGNGGGIYFSSVRIILAVITDSRISGNTAGNNGGGISTGLYDEHVDLFLFMNSVLSGNAAGQNGGGIFGERADLIFMNSILSGNTALQSGAGVYFGEGSRISEMINTTIADNWAGSYGGGIYGSCSVRLPTITNSILWGNTDNSGTGLLAQVQVCGDEADADATFSCIQDDNPDDANIPGGAELHFNIDDDPCFVMRGFWADANDTGTPVEPDDPNAVWVEGDYHLLIDSPCVDAGSSALLPPARSMSTDIDGQPRVIDQDVDMGADEFGLAMIVNSPQEGDVWAGGSSHQINWYSYQTAGSVDISYSDDNGAAWVPIETAVPDTGTYTWQVPGSVDSTQSLVQVVPTILEPNVIIIDSGHFTIRPDFVHPLVPSQWPSLAGGFDRSSLSANFGPEVGCVKWQFQTDSPVISSVTAGPGGRTYIAWEDGKLYTLDSTGSLVWIFNANSPILCAPTVGPHGSIYIGTDDGILYAVSIAGTIRWTHRTGGFIWSSPAVSADGTVYVASADGRLYALANNGTLLWTFEINARGDDVEGAIYGSPAIAPDGTVYIGGLYDPNLYALDPNDGTVKWFCNFEYTQDPGQVIGEPQEDKAGWPFVSPVIASDGTIYQALLFDPNLYAIEPNSGTILWSTNLDALNIPDFRYCSFLSPCAWREWPYPYEGDGYQWWLSCGGYEEIYLQKYPYVDGWTEPALGPDGTIYVSLDDDPFLRAVEPNGTIRWVKNIGIRGGYSLAVGADGLVYVASDDTHLTVLEPDGNEIARFRGTDSLRFPVIADNDTIIVTDADNIVKQIAASGCDGMPAALHRPEDSDGSWIVNNVDFAMLADHWMECVEIVVPYWEPYRPPFYEDLPTYLQGDINRDFTVNYRDLQLLTDRWLTSD